VTWTREVVTLPLLIALSACARSAVQPDVPENEAWIMRQSVQVREFDTSRTLATGLEQPVAPFGMKVAESIAESLRSNEVRATAIRSSVPVDPSAVVVEGRILAIDSGSRALRWAVGMGAGAVVVSIEGRVTAPDRPLVGEFNCTSTGRFGFVGGNTNEMLEENTINVSEDAAYRVFIGEYNGRAETSDPAVPVAPEAVTPPDEEASRIMVAPGDMFGGRYRVLGQVEWPEKGVITTLPCDPDRIRQEAASRFGNDVDAVIGFHSWQDGDQQRCGGTAVKATQQ